MAARLKVCLSALGAASIAATPPAAAQGQGVDPTLRDSFSIGEQGGSLCAVQATVRDSVIRGMFDRAWVIVCRDASQPVGYVRMLRADRAEAAARIDAGRTETIDCSAAGTCTVRGSDIAWQTRIEQQGETAYAVEGFAAYGDALDIALESVRQRRVVPGVIRVATTSVGGNDGFARTLAGTIDVDKALAEGYRRNHSGDYAEAAEFFEALSRRALDEQDAVDIDPTEFTLNRALQRSNLGEFSEAERLFGEVEAIPTSDPVQLRLRRNFRAIHALNQRDLDGAASILQAPVPPLRDAVTVLGGAVTLTPEIVAGVNSGTNSAIRQDGGREKLTPAERAKIIDAQADHLFGTAERLRGNASAAKAAQIKGLGDAIAVREGRVTSIIRLRSQMLGELALAEEALGNIGAADARFIESVNALAVEYPETNALASARARYAAFLTRHGQDDKAIGIYREVVSALASSQRSTTGMANMMAPYYRLLTERVGSDAAAINDFFVASQLQIRPGVADTQAVLARELSSGSDEGARLFRQATTIARDIERARIEDARLAQLPATAEVNALRADLKTQLDNLAFQQTETIGALSAFPQYRVVASGKLELTELQQVLRPDEAYLKMLVVGDAVYGMLIEPGAAQLWRSDIGAGALEGAVDQLRSTISVVESGRRVTYPFDAATARSLYSRLFGPVAERLPTVSHLIFEPDGAMLKLPINLLVTADTGLAAYEERLLDVDADPFDMRQIAWLGRATRPSTAVSALGFRNARQAAPSNARNQYFGLGENVPVTGLLPSLGTRGAVGVGVDDDCQWDLAQWSRPISSAELVTASNAIGRDTATLLTGGDFTDTAVKTRSDLSDYRIIHFATHGLVTAPRRSCPARPALVTSFGDGQSDGLLTFQEIFELKIDADLVILSACDTAGAASVAATREAGISSGGGNALDGLVRSFIGAGGRSVIASHWPAPDDFDATRRLIGGLFTARQGDSVADALWATQQQLMDDQQTSHPYYWAGFAIIGDGGQPLLHAIDTASTAQRGETAGRSAR
ncbi:CHAT domain-containing protein [Sphingopyxis sp. XHP0097]|uniref:CHAT domain-containing protein n=1 Tax=Sphingopyxis jiangsuensis TaxID=2871171 RepID=A0ABS7MG49_9SPHN|nr:MULTISPECIES: CHAT domain-containing protein [Sphingopyxis]MBY4638006.1 CHAT domain-containing protein [Sphingopyxis jiangsuensis]